MIKPLKVFEVGFYSKVLVVVVSYLQVKVTGHYFAVKIFAADWYKSQPGWRGFSLNKKEADAFTTEKHISIAYLGNNNNYTV